MSGEKALLATMKSQRRPVPLPVEAQNLAVCPSACLLACLTPPGARYPLEMHIVHFVKKDQLPACGDSGCPVVLGIMLALTDNEDEVAPELRALIETMPLNEGEKANLTRDIDINALLPKDMSYFTYEGSLTTPPCT